MSPSKKLALVGCGAVTQQYLVPALKQLPGCAVEWFVDTNLSSARQACVKYGHGHVTDNYLDTISRVDAAIVAVPNYLHSKISIDFLKAGRDVLCEKPIADKSENAVEMIKASRCSSARLAVNLVRRRFDCYVLARRVLNQGILGKISRIEYEEGRPITWPFSSSYILQKEKSGGGVLIDIGVHSIDLLSWLFGCDWRLISYRDDGLLGIESNCEIDFLINQQSQIPCSVKLSYTRRLGNKLTVVGDQCCLKILESDLTGVYLRVAEFEARIGETGTRSYASYFRDQIVSFLSKSVDEHLAGEDALNSLLFIEDCYRKKQKLTYPWEEPTASDLGLPISLHNKRILVVGASGFLGTRLTEKLALDLGLSVRGTFHRPERATRLARLPIELIECNLLKRHQVMQAVEGCDIVVNCAIGRVDTSGDASTAMDVYGSGTRNLLEAARVSGVKKLVHISTAAVHGFRHKSKRVDESFPFKSRFARSLYEKGKISQEKLVMEFAKSVPTVILRPTLIYGPYSEAWAVNIVDRLVQGTPTLVENGGLANLVYVDDVVDAILLAIGNEGANGRPLILNNDEEIVPWTDYLSKFASLTRTSANVLPAGHLSIIRFKRLVSLCADSVVACRDNLGSHEMLMLLARIPLVAVLGSKLVRGARRKQIEEHLLSTDETPISNLRTQLAKYETMPRTLHDNLTCRTVFSSSLAKANLGWKPRTTFIEGSGKTLKWAQWVGLGRENSAPAR